jgi:hypothetical protein
MYCKWQSLFNVQISYITKIPLDNLIYKDFSFTKNNICFDKIILTHSYCSIVPLIKQHFEIPD